MRRFEAVLILIFSLALIPSLLATSVRPVNLPEMVELADRVFRGKCLSAVKEESTLGAGLTVRQYRFLVIEGLKGVSDGDEVVFRQIRGVGYASIAGVPEYHKGEEVLLFLAPNSRLGLTSPIGMIQGKFSRQGGEQGETSFVNGVNNQNLAYQMDRPEVRSDGLSPGQIGTLRDGGPIPMSVFRQMIETIHEEQSATKVVQQ
jgi:hypothetical protein